MKQPIYQIIVCAGLLASCAGNPEGEKAVTTEEQQVAAASGMAYATDSSSTITWTGTKPTGKHIGTFAVKEGNLFADNGTLTGGNFTIDINSLLDLDMAGDPKSKGDLEGHLKSPDFFDVAKFPTAKFEITSVMPADSAAMAKLKDATHVISGNLTMKDSTKNISFPAKLMMDSSSITAQADFNIDRSQWGMNYKGPENPADWVISKEVNLKLAISAKRK
jgi:polyisoprenoid-binding protein YceI